jgi:hypothetical protein
MRWVVFVLALASVAHAQPEAGVPDAGLPTEAGLPDAGLPTEAGVDDAGLVPLDAGLPLGEREDDEEAALPEALRPELEYRIEPADGIMTGDLVHAILVVRLRGEDDDVTIPRQELGDLELHDQRHTDRRENGRRIFTFELDFLALEPGEHEIAPITLRVVTDSGVIGTIRTEARTVTVGALTANEPDAQPRPATAPVPVMQDDYTLAYLLGFVAAMLLSALIGYLVARWWRARPKPVPPPPPPRPPGEVALEKLRTLKRRMRGAIEEGKAAEVVDGASDALREYLGHRYGFNGLESTTDEVIARVRHERLGAISPNEIIALLGDADLVKFAKAEPDAAQCERMIEGAERIVLGTVPMATAVTPPARRVDQTPARAKGRAARSVDAPPPSTGPEPGGSGSETPSPAPSGPEVAPSLEGTATRGAEAPSAEAAAPVAPEAVAPAPPAPDAESAPGGEGEVDHLGRRIPDTNPPPPPSGAAPLAPAGPGDRATPVGRRDPDEGGR